MTIINSETFYILYERQINLVKGYTENSYIPFIFKACRLKPLDIIYLGQNKSQVKLYKNWVDEWGNRLEITTYKRKKYCKIIYNDLSLNRNKLSVIDLYENLSIKKTSKISNLAFILTGKEEDFQTDHIIISLLGIDGFLRSFCFIYGEWIKIPPLQLGMEILEQIAEDQDLRYFKTLEIKNSILFPCIKQQGVLTCWEPSQEFLGYLNGLDYSITEKINQVLF